MRTFISYLIGSLFKLQIGHYDLIVDFRANLVTVTSFINAISCQPDKDNCSEIDNVYLVKVM